MPPSIPDIPIVYFHSVAPQKDITWVRNFLTLELSVFEQFLEYLYKNRWQTIFLDEYYHIKRSGKKPGSKVCCLTFDDGFLDNYIYAFPLLKKYGFKGTIFISPEFVDVKRQVALTLDDVWKNRVPLQNIDQWGYLSWEELRIMEKSGLVDIQSHTLTHTKFFTSDTLTSFHFPGADCLYPIGNLYPERKPYYHRDKDFERLIPFGTPFFKASSAIIARRVWISGAFNVHILDMLSVHNWSQPYAMEKAFEKVNKEYQYWKTNQKIIENIESQREYEKRLYSEIVSSKNIIEKELHKKVEFLCWPHGDNNKAAHDLALESGYKMTTAGKAVKNDIHPLNRIGERMGINYNGFMNTVKTKIKFKAFAGIFPYSELLKYIRK